jgi:RNA polymerase sigma-70 factor, ECF subfamily
MNSLEQDAQVEPSDAEYVVSSRNGHPEDFRLLIERYQRPLFAFVAGRLESPVEAEEAAQESFVRAFLSLRKLRKPESFYAWLLGIAGRVLKEQFRAHERRHRERDAAEALVTEGRDPVDEYPIEEAIAVLPESYRQVILLRYYEGLSCQQVGERLGMPLGTVTKTLSRAYAVLRQELKSRENNEETINQMHSHELR